MATAPARSTLDRQGAVDGLTASLSGNVIYRPCFRILTLDLPDMVHPRPLVSVAVGRDRSSLGYSLQAGPHMR
jgi:hypothetical protein